MADFRGTTRYQVLDRIGRGGMGVVYRVWDGELRREVALKTMRRPGAGEIFRIKTEFRARKEINHPNIVDFYDLVVDDDDCFFTMELLPGADFLTWVRTQAAAALSDAPTVDLHDDPPTRESNKTEGVGPDPRARPPRRQVMAVDVDRLRDGLKQLVEGLDAQHQVGCLHRDIKPGNVLVSPEGRVVLLDFGLAVSINPDDEKARIDGPVAGTAAYMSPEAVWRDGLGPPADFYAVGVMIYEALTGRRPWRGQMFEVLRAKQSGLPPAPSSMTFGVPPDLESICMDLLEPKPDARPTAPQLLARLGAAELDPASVTLTGQLVLDMKAPFLGRDEELADLQSAFARVDAGHPTTVHIAGRSGMGKSSLVRKFVHGVEKEPHVLVLEGRCHLHESVAFKALDGVVDALSRFLVNEPNQSLMSIIPAQVADLIRLFPVLGRIEAFEAASAAAGDASPDPQESRRRAFGALRELLVRIGRRRTVVIWIDDLQWGDLDSASLLRELLRRPDPPPVLLLLSWRSEERESSPLLRVLLGDGPLALPAKEVRQVDVEPLGDETGRDLSHAILGLGLARHEHRIDEILRDAAGSPFLISQLVRYIAASEGRPSGDFPPVEDSSTPPARRYLGNIVLKRVKRLSDPARSLLETISIAARPLERGLALQAAGLGASDQLLVRHLEREFLLRATRISDRIAIETYHDGIREAIVDALTDEGRRARHLALAEALLEVADPEPQALVEHFQGAGDLARAGAYAVAAATRAAETLAFDRAARLYRLAIDLAPHDADPLALQVGLAEALSNAGQSAEAGAAFRQTAQLAAARGADPVDVLRYQRQAADQYLRAGVVDEGMAALADVLRDAGMKLPTSRGGALAQILFRRASLAVRGMGFQLRTGADVPAEALVHLDATWGATTTLSLIDPLLAGVFGVRHLRSALELGEHERLARALGHEASYQASIGGARGRAAAADLLNTVEELGRDSADPYDSGWLKLAQGTTAYLSARWSEAALCCDEGTRVFRSQCTGVSWELVSTESFAVSALAHRGDLVEVGARRSRLVQEAEERGDLFATTGFRLGILALVDLAADEAGDVRERADGLIQRWPSHAFLTQHYLHLLATVMAALYENDGADAFRRMEEAWPRLRRDHFLRLQTMRVELWHLRARAALGALGGGPGVDEARALLRVVRQAIKAIRQDEDNPWARPAAAQLEAALAAREGRNQEATEHLVRAAAGYQAADMRLYAAACRYVDGALTGSRGGDDKHAHSAEWIAAQGVGQVGKMVRTLVPGFGVA